MVQQKQYYYAIGRRKSSRAKVRVQKGSGSITINEKPAIEYLRDSKYLLGKLAKPFAVLEIENKFDVSAKVEGGGLNGQVESIQLGIAKSLAIMDETLKSTLKRADLLGRDPREKERKKFGLKGARKKRQFTKR